MTSSKAAKFGVVIFALSLAQFIMTVDTTIMNIAIPTVVEDLDTTVGAVQSAITLYALTMAAFMLIGAKLGEIYGRKRIFKIGLVIYAIGSLLTAIAPNLSVLIIGWSLLEGIGASLMMPAMMALITINFSGKKRLSALGIIAGVAGAAAAVGPLIGGALSTYATWRWAFVAEVVIALLTLFLSKYIIDNAKRSNEKLDVGGAALSATGLGVFVFGILQASEYGWIRAIKPLEIGDRTYDLFGISIVAYLCAIGIGILWWFFRYENRRLKEGQPVLLKVSLLKIQKLLSGLNIVLITQLVLGGFMFVVPLFLQVVLGFSAIKSGFALLPLSIALIGTSVLSGKLTARYAVIKLIRASQVAILLGLILMVTVVNNDTEAIDLLIPMVLIGGGIGIIFPLNQSIVLGSVDKHDSSQASGLNYTYQQLGMSLGTAVIGSVLLFSLSNSFVSGLSSSSSFDQAVVEQQGVQISSNIEFVSNEQLSEALDGSDATPEQREALLVINTDARLRALRASVSTAAIFMLIGLVVSGRLKDALAHDQC